MVSVALRVLWDGVASPAYSPSPLISRLGIRDVEFTRGITYSRRKVSSVYTHSHAKIIEHPNSHNALDGSITNNN